MTDAINSVQVFSIDEEKLKYRVIVVLDGANGTPANGAYQVVLPPLSSFGNSDHYDNALIKLDCAMFGCMNAGVNDQVWDVVVGGAHFPNKVNAVEVRMNAPSAQTALNMSVFPAFAGVGDTHQGNFRQLVPLELVLTGGGTGALTIGLIPGPGSALNDMTDYSWKCDCSNSEPIMCGNPFGSQIVISNRMPGVDSRTYIISHGAGGGSPDVGLYQYQFTITMVPRRE